MITSISGGFHRFRKSAKSARRQRENKMECLHGDIYSKILGFRLPVCPVIKNKVMMLIKV